MVESKILTTTQSNAVTETVALGANLPSGFEQVTASNMIIPRLAIIQGLSPQVKPGNSKYNPEARVGQIHDVVLGDLAETINVLPFYFYTKWIEWVYPRGRDGKSIVRIHDSEPTKSYYSGEVTDKGQPLTKDGNVVQETAHWFVLNLSNGGNVSVIPMTSSQLKNSKEWMTRANLLQIDGRKAKLFEMSYKLTTKPESSNGNDWMGWKISPDKKLRDLENATSLVSAIGNLVGLITKNEVIIEHDSEIQTETM